MGIFVGKQKIDKKSLILQERYWRRNNFGMELRDAIGYCNENGEYTKDTHRFNLDFNGLKEIPENGFYKFRETGCDRIWIITDSIKITKIIDEEERMEILESMNYDEMEAFAPYKASFEKRMKQTAS